MVTGEVPMPSGRERAKREQDWNVARNIADKLVQTYVEYGFLDDKGWLDQVNQQVRNVLMTNAELQEQLREQDQVVRGLRNEHKERESDWVKVEAEVVKSKAKQQKVETHSRETHGQRVSNERALWDKEVSLQDRLAQLYRDRARLLEQRRSEDVQMAKLKDASTKLHQELLGLNMRKAELEQDDHSEYDYLSAAQEEHFSNEDPDSAHEEEMEMATGGRPGKVKYSSKADSQSSSGSAPRGRSTSNSPKPALLDQSETPTGVVLRPPETPRSEGGFGRRNFTMKG